MGFKITLGINYLCKLFSINEKQVYKKYAYFDKENTRDFASFLTGISRPTINRFYKTIRERIAELCKEESPFCNGEVELDESYFGARRVRGLRGRGAKGKNPVLGMLKRGDKVYV